MANIKLWIIRALVLICLCIAGWAIWLGWSKLRQENTQLKATLTQQAGLIESLTTSAKISSDILKSLSDKQQELANNSRESLATLYKLEQDNEQIKDYLITSVPPDIGELLNSARIQDSGTKPTGNTNK